MNNRTTILGAMETIIAVLLAIQAMPKEAWADPKVWVTVVLLAGFKTARDFYTADK